MRKLTRLVSSRGGRLVVAGLGLLGLLCLVMAWQNYGVQGADFDADPTAPARVGTSSSGGLSTAGVLWLIAGILLLGGVVATVLSRRKH